MEKQNPKIEKLLKNIKSPNFIYLTIFFIFVAGVGILFLFSTNFIIENINKIFSPTNDGATQALDLKSYSVVAKRFGFPVNTPVGLVASATSTAKSIITLNTPAPTSSVLLKTATLTVLNSTGKKGVASLLATSLEQAGFSKVSTGNEKKTYSVTTIYIKEAQKDLSSLVENVVKKTYPKAVTLAAKGTETSDITIIIGKE